MNSFAWVEAWEEGRKRSRIERPLVLLAASRPGTSLDEWARLPIGARDAQLLRLREELFGAKLNAATSCPRCGESLDISLSTEDIRVEALPLQSNLEFELADGEYGVRFRLPTTADLSAIAGEDAAEDPRVRLLARCVLDATRNGSSTEASELPLPVQAAMVNRMGEADPQAVVELAMECPACNYPWSIPFDICSYLWIEIEDLVQRLFREVHTLASAYGWSEREILDLSPVRRRFYLDMVEG